MRFLTQSSQFSSIGVRAVAFLPNPKHGNTSVFRGTDTLTLRGTFEAARTDGKVAKALAVLRAHKVREVHLDVLAEEPPPAHANIERWPRESDPELQKAQQMKLAGVLAASSELLKL